MTTIFGNTYTPFLVQDLSTNNLLNHPISSCVDSQGNLFVGTYGNGLFVLSPIDTTIFGIPCTANTLTSLSGVSGMPALGDRYVLCLDAADNLYMGIYITRGLYVITQTTTTIFGVACTANQSNNLTPSVDPTGLIISPTGLAFDKDGNLFIVNGWAQSYNTSNAKILVLTNTGPTLFGVPCVANTLTDISVVDSGNLLYAMKGICFDSQGNLYIGNDTLSTHVIAVLPKTTGTIYGISCTQNIVSTLIVTNATVEGNRIDPNDNLCWVQQNNTLHVLAAKDSFLYGVLCLKNTPQNLTTIVDPNTVINNPYDLCFDAANNLFIMNRNSVTPAVLPFTNPTFPTLGFGIYITTDVTFVFDYQTVQDYIAGKPISVFQGVYAPPGIILTDLHRVVYTFGKNKLKTYAFREVQLPGSLRSVYLCVWAASGVSPSMLS